MMNEKTNDLAVVPVNTEFGPGLSAIVDLQRDLEEMKQHTAEWMRRHWHSEEPTTAAQRLMDRDTVQP